ncbi:E2F transcription factor-like E2FE [Acorus gramineus]|uniref:E2F transcription factor-like E2FE n=1 Tax=Acorus gramineus TaxID=55184 RepID=A0AAV9AW88_ACOGR|nr:E2F transcription factor-like E2FE [Acorus gramineus]
MVDSGSLHYGYSRKQKSLGLLCTNFLGLYDRDGIDTVGLDDTASKLGVERRRIYDIVNVLESIGVLARKAKNRYSWIGHKGIPHSLRDLKEEALNEKTNPSLNAETEVFDSEEDEKPINLSESGSTALPIASSSSTSILSFKPKTATDQRREKSLGQLTRNFVKLFLVSDVDTISLDDAASILLGDINNPSQMRNNSAAKVRRLYDIANVLSSMNLIEKTHQSDTRKPAFRWLGFNGIPEKNTEVAMPAKPLGPNQFNRSDLSSSGVVCARPLSPKQPMKRAFGTDITNNVSIKRSKPVSSVDSKPSKMKTKLDELTECNRTAERQLGSKGHVFGPFEPVKVIKQEENNGVDKRHQDWEKWAVSFQPRYQNQALGDLFQHYMEAWKSWCIELAQGSRSPQEKTSTQQTHC